MAIHAGVIVWAIAPSARGEGKRRPFIIASTSRDIKLKRNIRAIACSTSFGDPLDPHEIPLPFDPNGHPTTGLKGATVAVCDWIEEFPAETRFEMAGQVPGELRRVIFEIAGITLPPER